MRHDIHRLRAGLAAVCLAASLAACAPQVRVHGFVPTERELQDIEPGFDTIDTVAERIGRPANSSLLGEPVWYYVQSRMEQVTYNPPRETERQVVAIAFTEEGLVESIARFGLEDGRVVNLNTRVTESGTGRQSVLQQIFANLFNFDFTSAVNQ